MRIVRVLAVSMAAALAGCQDSGIDLSSRAGPKVTVGASVPVALAGIEGMPADVAPRFSAALTAEAQARDIRFVDGGQSPRFRLKGYLDAYRSDAGATLAWVWDVFDTRAQRAQRITGSQTLSRSGADVWAGVDDAMLLSVAARSLDEVGAFLAAHRQAETPVAAGAGARNPADARAAAE